MSSAEIEFLTTPMDTTDELPQGAVETSGAGIVASCGKNDIKISEEGVAKLSFSFLDDVQGDSSLEPGEVKTPPHGSSPVLNRDIPSLITPKEKSPEMILAREKTSKIQKTASQLEAEACEEKVRLILELDAKKREEEKEKRRQQGNESQEDKEKKKSKEERKKLKELKKAQKAAKRALMDIDRDDEQLPHNDIEGGPGGKKPKETSRSKSEDSEGLCSSGDDEDLENVKHYVDKVPSKVSVVNAPRLPPCLVLNPSHPPAHLSPEAFLGFRGMNPFMRGPRLEFPHGRVGFMPRGRCGPRSRMPFASFRPPFFSVPGGLGNIHPGGGSVPRHHGPAHRHQHTPPPNRGHSPILAPSTNLQWTKCKPSLSYALRSDTKQDVASTLSFNMEPKLSSSGNEKKTGMSDAIDYLYSKDNLDLQSHSKNKKSKDSKKASKNGKKRAKEDSKSKASTSSSALKAAKTSSKSKLKKASKRNIEKIRKSYKMSTTATTTDGTDCLNEVRRQPTERDEEFVPDAEEIRNKVQNMKVEKVDAVTEFKIEDITLKVKPMIMVKQEPKDEVSVCKKTKSDEAEKSFDIFAYSPPHSGQQELKEKPTEDVKRPDTCPGPSNTPPLANMAEEQPQCALAIQNALEIQKRIDKILQQDDIKLEAIEAAKEMLMRKTQKHQIAKDKQTRSSTAIEEECSDARKDCKNKKVDDSRKDTGCVKEKPMAYKDKYSLKHVSTQKDRQHHGSSKQSELSKHKDYKERHERNEVEKSSSAKRESKRDEKDRDASRHSYEKYKYSRTKDHNETKKHHSESSLKTRNPFKRSSSRERESKKVRERKRSQSKGRENASKRHQSDERKRESSSGKSSSGQRRSGGSSHSSHAHITKSEEKDINARGSMSCKDKSNEETTSHLRSSKSYANKSPTRSQEKSAEAHPKSQSNIDATSKLNTATSKATKKNAPKQKNRPLSFSQSEFLSPDLDESNDFQMYDDSQDFTSLTKTPSLKEGSPDTDDYMDNWENDEDVDIDVNLNTSANHSTSLRVSPNYREDDSFVSRFVNPSPPADHVESQQRPAQAMGAGGPSTPPLELLPDKPVSADIEGSSRQNELFGMQELYDQFIKSVEESGVVMKSSSNEISAVQASKVSITNSKETGEEILSTSSTSTSSTSSSASSSTEDNSLSSSSSSSSTVSSDESNDVDHFKQANDISKKNLDTLDIIPGITALEAPEPKRQLSCEKVADIPKPPQGAQRECQTTSPPPLLKPTDLQQTPPATAPQAISVKTDASKDFKKLKNLEANLSRIQMMRASYDSNDEISEELHKMEMLFLQEKRIILQKYAKSSSKEGDADSQITASTAMTTLTPTLTLPKPEPNVCLAPPSKSDPPKYEINKIFDANRETIKLTLSPMKLPTKPAIFQAALADDSERKTDDEKEEVDFTEKLVKPVKEVAIVKPMMGSKETHESRSKDSRHRRSPGYTSSRERPRSPTNHRDRNRRSSSKSQSSPHRRSGKGRSLSASPPRKSSRHRSPPRRNAAGARARASNRRSRSRSRSRSPRHFIGRRGKDVSPARFRKSTGQTQYKKFGRFRSSRSRSRSRSPQRPRSPRTPPTRRRSYSDERYSPLPFKPPSPPMRRSMSPLDSTRSSKRSRSPHSPRRPRSPRSPRQPRSPVSPPHSTRYKDHRRRRDNSFERQSSISPQQQYYPQDALSTGVSAAGSSYYYDLSPSGISVDAHINIVLNGAGGPDTPPTGYEDYSNYAQYSNAAYMSIPPQPIADGSGVPSEYYPNPYVSMLPGAAGGHHNIQLPPHSHMGHSMHSSHPPCSHLSAVGGTINPQGTIHPYYYNDFSPGHQVTNPVLKEIPKVSSVAVQKGNVLEIVPSNVNTPSVAPVSSITPPTVPVTGDGDSVSSIKHNTANVTKPAAVSWMEEVNNRQVKVAVMRLTREGEGAMRSILKRSDPIERPNKTEKKKVYFEDGIYPSRDSDDEDRKLVEQKMRRKILRIRRKRGLDTVPMRELLNSLQSKYQIKISSSLKKLQPPPPPQCAPSPYLEQPTYLRPPTPVPLVYFHFDSVVHSMYVSQLEKPIPPRLLNPKCVPPPAPTCPSAAVSSHQSPNMSSPTCAGAKKDFAALAAFNRVGNRTEAQALSSAKVVVEQKRQCHNAYPSQLNKLHSHYPGSAGAMAPMRHGSSPMGFVGMRINNFTRLPPSPLTRGPTFNMPALGQRHPQFHTPPPAMPPDSHFAFHQFPSPHKPPPGFLNMHQRPPAPGYFMSSQSMHHPPPPLPADGSSHQTKPSRVISPQVMVAPFNMKKDC